jgi:Domain of unknown function (DUF4388)
VLQGSLDTFGLEDVVAFLAATAKTGRLHLSGDRGTGSLWFAAGDVVAAMAANVPLQADISDVVFELLRYRRGEFAFALGERAPDPGPPHAVAPLLEQVQVALEEWRELTAAVPSADHRVRLLAEPLDDHVILDRVQWRTILAVGAGSTVAELGDALGEGELPVLRRVCDLLAKGLVEVLDPSSQAATSGPLTTRRAEPAPIQSDAAHTAAAVGAGADADADAETAAVVPGPEVEPIDHTLLEQLGGLSPRAAQAVSEVAARGDHDDSVLMSMLRDEL